MDTLTMDQILAANLADWRKLAQALHTRYRIADYRAGARFVAAVAEAATQAEHHPDVTLRPGVVDIAGAQSGHHPDVTLRPGVVDIAGAQAEHHPDVTLRPGVVDIALGTHVDGVWVTQKDVDLARVISALAREHGATAEPSAVTQVEPGLDTADHERIGPFWSAVLTGSPDNIIDTTVLDPTGRVPNIWFQGTDAHDEPRQRWHLDVWVDPAVAEQRIAAAVAAGGTVVDDEGAPQYTVLADADGNKACICTNQGRE